MPRRARLAINPEDIQLKSAYTPEERENQIVAEATNEAERRILDGSASDQLLIHYLKLATEENKLKNAILEREHELVAAKTEAIQSVKNTEILYRDAIAAMRKYGGDNDDN